MFRLPYELVAIEVDKLSVKLVSASDRDIATCMERYYLFIEACGWSSELFEREMLSRIDAEWDNRISKLLN